MGGIVMTSDGNAILREIVVQHPAAKSMIEIARTQDEEVGDGTTSVIVLGECRATQNREVWLSMLTQATREISAGEMLSQAEQFIAENMHPTVIIGAYLRALDDAIELLENEISIPVNLDDTEEMKKIVRSCIGTKLMKQWYVSPNEHFLSPSDAQGSDARREGLAVQIALEAVKCVTIKNDGTRPEVDIKRYAKVEKVPGGQLEDSEVLTGVMVNKDVTHAKMRRRIENPRILLLDCGLEYTKGESQTNIEITNEGDFARLLEIEEEYIQGLCANIIAVKPDLVFTEKGVSDLAQHFLQKANITAIRRVRKSDNNRIARAVGAQIVNRTDEIKEEDIGTGAGLFEVRKIGDEYFTFVTECKDPKACTILLRGPSQDLLKEVERNLQDAMNVVRNVIMNPRLVPGGGACEISLAVALSEKARSVEGVAQWPYKAVARALEVIPRTIIQNCGASTVRVLTELRAKHAGCSNHTWGVDGQAGVLADMTELGIWEPLSVKLQTIKTAIETATLLLRIDAIVSGSKKAMQ